MTFWTPDNLRISTGGTWLVRPPSIELPKDRPADLPLPPLYAPILGLSTDTRSIKPGQCFLALKGEAFDGHGFLEAAARAGAPVLIVADAGVLPAGGFEPACGVLKVEDTGRALLKIAAAYRASLKRTKVIAVCGSNGKTTTTRLIEHVLGQSMRGTASRKSFNNSVGVPLTICSARENDQYLICEVGTNAPGEIALLGDVVRPDIAVITSIGREHLEKLGDLAGVAAEEAAILKSLKPGGWAIVTADAPELAEHVRGIKNLITFGRSDRATLRLTDARHVLEGDTPRLAFTINGRQACSVPLVGEHNALNAIAALAVARRLGIDEAKAAQALAGAGGAEMRLQTCRVGGVTVLNDAYNANPDSMIAGIDAALALRKAGLGSAAGRTVLVLGEMLELGAAAEAGHRGVARHVDLKNRSGEPVDLVVLVGAGMRAAQDELVRAGWTRERLAYVPELSVNAAADVAGLLVAGDLVLVKGSRRVRLERVVEALDEADDDEGSGAEGSGEVQGAGAGLAKG